MKKFFNTLVVVAAVLLILPSLSFATPTPPAPQPIHVLNADGTPAIDILVEITADGTAFIEDPADNVLKEAQLWYYDYTFTNVGWKSPDTGALIGLSRADIPFGAYLFGAEFIGGSSITAEPGDPLPGDFMGSIYSQVPFVLTFDFSSENALADGRPAFPPLPTDTLDFGEDPMTVRMTTANLWTAGQIDLFDTVTDGFATGNVPIVDEDIFFLVKGNGVPEPGTLLLLGSGILGLAGLHRRRENNK